MRLFGGAAQRAEAEAYVEQAMPRLVGLAFAMTGNKADAEDLVQDTLALVITKWSRVREAEHLDAYVRRTMVNRLSSVRRRRAASEVVSHDAVTAEWSVPSVPSPERGVTEREAVLALIRGLPDRQRAVVALRYYEDLPDREIARTLGCTEQAVRSAAHAALTRLRELVPQTIGEEAQR
ncbi:SigE family RNA polymerase sigma factor [Serinicoccus kebangsaanensis]|uniref:SigE family RNA polymerase sigma factor n=1 Tax=Serinicoccus kebangsaanensis TaxID=2602069 RepID=UPI00124F1C84|nr:SigE family RNA polymerase sigma factor [Serinicoccus kebangsaanensis]